LRGTLHILAQQKTNRSPGNLGLYCNPWLYLWKNEVKLVGSVLANGNFPSPARKRLEETFTALLLNLWEKYVEYKYGPSVLPPSTKTSRRYVTI